MVDIVFNGAFDLIFAEGAIGIGGVLSFRFVSGMIGFVGVFVGWR